MRCSFFRCSRALFISEKKVYLFVSIYSVVTLLLFYSKRIYFITFQREYKCLPFSISLFILCLSFCFKFSASFMALSTGSPFLKGKQPMAILSNHPTYTQEPIIIKKHWRLVESEIAKAKNLLSDKMLVSLKTNINTNYMYCAISKEELLTSVGECHNF